jgi:mono/diheme cytochrome c family protein
MQNNSMKKSFITAALCFLFVAILFAQRKKPSTSPAAVKRGQAVYQMTCIACHQKDGNGVPRLNPPLAKSSYVVGEKAKLINIVLKGLNDPIEINGEEYNNAMPAQAQLSDQQIADVLTYVRNSFGNKASAVTATQVKAERAKFQ